MRVTRRESLKCWGHRDLFCCRKTAVSPPPCPRAAKAAAGTEWWGTPLPQRTSAGSVVPWAHPRTTSSPARPVHPPTSPPVSPPSPQRAPTAAARCVSHRSREVFCLCLCLLKENVRYVTEVRVGPAKTSARELEVHASVCHDQGIN